MRLKTLAVEFTHHFPFSVFSACLGIVIVGLLTAVAGGRSGEVLAMRVVETGGFSLLGTFRNLFHIFHPVHILFSAVATTAMFWRFDRRLWVAVLIGLVGSLGVCGVSDILIPFLGGLVSGKAMQLHVCLFEHPWLVGPFALVGVGLGLVAAEAFSGRRSTVFSHSSHVLVSTMASLLYLVSFGFTDWMSSVFAVFLIVVMAVLVPCCTSDIVFPLLVASPEARSRTCCGQ
jgi:hypothetical protein